MKSSRIHKFCGLAVLCILQAHAAATTRFLVMPVDFEGLDIFESLTFLLEKVDGIEAVPLDTSLKIRNNIGSDSDPLLRFAGHMGVDYALRARITPQYGGFFFQGELLSEDPERREPLILSGANSRQVAEAVAKKLLELTGFDPNPLQSRCSLLERAGSLFSMGVDYWHKGEIDRAVSFFEAVLDLDPVLPEALFRLGQCYLVRGDYPRAEEKFRTAMQLDGDRLFHLRCALELFKIHRDRNELQAAEAQMETAFQLAESMGAQQRLAYLWLEKGYFYLSFKKDLELATSCAHEAGNLLAVMKDKVGMANHAFLTASIGMRERKGAYFEEAMTQIDRAEGLAREMEYPQYLGVASLFRALNKKSSADFSVDENLRFFLDAETYFQSVGSNYSLLWARIQRVDYHLRRAEYESARALASEVRDRAAECGFFNFQIDAGNLMAQALMHLDKPQDAVGVLENNRYRLEERPVSFLVKNVLSRLVSAYLAMEAYDRALEISKKSLEHAQTSGDEKYQSLILNNHGEVLLLKGDLDEADNYFQQSLELKEKLNNPLLVAWTLRNLVLVRIHQNRLEDAARLLERGRSLVPNPLADMVLEARLRYAENNLGRANQLMFLIKQQFSDRWSDTLQEIFVDFETAGKAGTPTQFRFFLPNFL